MATTARPSTSLKHATLIRLLRGHARHEAERGRLFFRGSHLTPERKRVGPEMKELNEQQKPRELCVGSSGNRPAASPLQQAGNVRFIEQNIEERTSPIGAEALFA